MIEARPIKESINQSVFCPTDCLTDLGGEGDDAVDVALVAGLDDGAVDGVRDRGEEGVAVARAQLAHRHYKGNIIINRTG